MPRHDPSWKTRAARPRTPLLLATVLALPHASVTAQVQASHQVIFQFHGDAPGDYLGLSLAAAGDVNADGYPDIVAGAPLADRNGTQSGMVRVLSGRDGAILWQLIGDAPGDEFGWSVQGVGDVDRDGHADFIVGAPFNDQAASNAGMAAVYSGRTGLQLFRFLGDAAGDEFGFSVAGAGDVNGDGTLDFIIGAPFNDLRGFSAGQARIHSGTNGSLIRQALGDATGDLFGWSVAGLSDLDGDGRAEVVVGAELADGAGLDRGLARVFSGIDGSVRWNLVGDADHDRAGVSVNSAGDVDRDGTPDLIVGIYGSDSNGLNAGAARVFSGRTGGVLWTFHGDSVWEEFGVYVCGAGDVDGDGHADLVVGAFTDDFSFLNAGSAKVFSGRDGTVLFAAFGEGSGDEFGISCCGVGDLDRDGLGDVAVGAEFNSNAASHAGTVRVLSGRSPVRRLFDFHGSAAGEHLGTAVAPAGDVDRDGRPDLLTGAPEAVVLGVDRGVVRVRSGADGSVILTVNGDAAGDRFGAALAMVGDLDQDGRPDFIVGAPRHGTAGVDAGRARVLSGLDGSPLFVLEGQAAGDQFGSAVAGVGDVNHDGTADFAVGAPFADAGGQDAGSVQVFSGRDGALLHTWNGPAAGSRFGAAIAGAGDLDADAWADVMVGAPGHAANGADSGLVQVFSGQSGGILFTFLGDAAGDQLGHAVAAAGDVNRDGTPDLIAGAPGSDVTGTDAGSVRVWSGANGAVLFNQNGTMAGDRMGTSVAGAGDADRDGHADFLAGAPGNDDFGLDAGQVRIWSGRNAVPLFVLRGEFSGDHFGAAVAAAGDVNQDGSGDLVVGAPDHDTGGASAGAVRVATVATPSLDADRVWLSLGRGGMQTLTLTAGVANAGSIYFLLGSFSGTYPGTDLGTVGLPLNVDPLTFLTLQSANRLPFGNSLGILDQSGNATASFTVVSGLGSDLIGAQLKFAYLLLDLGTLTLDFASNPVLLTLVP
jgi:hypothetical protein